MCVSRAGKRVCDLRGVPVEEDHAGRGDEDAYTATDLVFVVNVRVFDGEMLRIRHNFA